MTGEQPDVRDVVLYEDNAGFLYLHREGDDVAYAEVEQLPEDQFRIDAPGLAYRRDLADWTLPQVPLADVLAHPETKLVARYHVDPDGTATVTDITPYPGNSARFYCGLWPFDRKET